MKNIYFITDAHLGSRALDHARTRERRLVNFLDSIKKRAAAVYLLGDMFDFWYEYKMVVPKGYTRFLGKLSELTDQGVEVHFFTGNHDIWCGDYLEKECGVMVHRHPLTVELYGKVFYMAHGDECFVKYDALFSLLRSMFHNRFLQRMFSAIHPRWSVDLGLAWAKHSMIEHKGGIKPILPYRGEDKEPCVLFAKEYLEKNHSINFFVFGHRHCQFEVKLGENSKLIALGDWMSSCSYMVFNEKELVLNRFIEGETKP